MPTNRHLTFSDRQSEAARMKKLPKAISVPAPEPAKQGGESAVAPESQVAASKSAKATAGKAAKKQSTGGAEKKVSAKKNSAKRK